MEKSHTERSGAAGTGNDHFWFYDPEIHEPRGWTIPDMVRDISTDGEYGKTKGGLMDQELLEIVAAGTKEAVDRLERWGVAGPGSGMPVLAGSVLRVSVPSPSSSVSSAVAMRW